MLLSPRKNGLTSLFEEVRVFKERAQRLTFWVRRRGFHAKGWWPKSSCPPSKVCLPWVSKRSIWDVSGILPGCPGPLRMFKKLVQKKFVRIFRSLSWRVPRMAGAGHFPSEFRANSEFRASYGQIPSKFRANSGQIPGKFRANSEQIPGEFRASVPNPLFPCHSVERISFVGWRQGTHQPLG